MSTRSRIVGRAFALAVLLLPGSGLAAAEMAALDCTRPADPFQTFVCRDPQIVQAHERLEATRAAALAKVQGDRLETDYLERRRHRWSLEMQAACASADDRRACLLAEYDARVAELQTAYALVPTRPAMMFRCDDDPTVPLLATIYDTVPPTVRLERDGAMMEAYEVPAEKGMRFEGEDILFASDGKEAQVMWIAQDLHCVAEPAG